jgi:hypothetical protein
MAAMQIRDVPDEDRAALVHAARRRNMSLQRYLAEQVHLLAVRERNRRALEELSSLDDVGGAMTGAELDELRDTTRAAHAAHLADKSGIGR